MKAKRQEKILSIIQNNTITTQLGIPTITVETFRGYEMERRIGDQLDVVQYVIRYYGMVP